MRKLEIQASSIEEAKIKAFQEGITVVHDATSYWRRRGSPVLTKELNILAADFLEQNQMFDFKNAGIIIVVSSGKENDKKHPYTLEKFRRVGRCIGVRTLEIRAQDDDTILGTAKNKTTAIKLARELIKKHKKDLYGKTVFISPDIDFKMKYDPSVKAKQGQYIVFGVDEADVKISQRKSRGFE